MLEWTLIKNITKNPKFVNILGNSSHPLIRKLSQLIDGDLIQIISSNLIQING